MEEPTKLRPRVRVLLPLANGKFLMEKLQNPKYPHTQGKIRLPGGGVDDGELWEQAARRELYEEFDVQTEQGELRYVGTKVHYEWGCDEHYYVLLRHGLKPGVYKSKIEEEGDTELIEAHPSDPNYYGCSISDLTDMVDAFRRLYPKYFW